ncbi:MAG: CDP-diacylglycerol--glycerol-3-phosphate 3-phosphatidyltransferase [Cyanobacteria bacterium P01_H01_bin.153]
MNLPTWITLSRLLGAPLLLLLLREATPQRAWWAVGIFLLAASTDWVDGYLARRLNQVTELGKFLDPLVDKLLVLAPLLALIELGKVPAWGVFLVLVRELTITGWRVSPTFQRQSVPGANLWGKSKTVVQIAAVACLLAPLPSPSAQIGLILFWAAVILTWVSGLTYVWPQPPNSSEPQ